MRRIPIIVALGAGILLCATVWAQEVVLQGWVRKIDPVNSRITLRTTGNPRVVPVASSAVVLIDGKVGKLEDIPLESEVHITAIRQGQGEPQATRIEVISPTPLPSAASPPGAIVRGTVVGLDPAQNAILVHTLSGDVRVDLGTASIFSNSRQTSLRAINIGDTVEVQRTIPTDAGSNYVTRVVTVLHHAAGTTTGTAPAAAFGRMQGQPAPAAITTVVTMHRTPTSYTESRTVRTRTSYRTSRVAGYRSRYQARRAHYRRHRIHRAARYRHSSHGRRAQNTWGGTVTTTTVSRTTRH